MTIPVGSVSLFHEACKRNRTRRRATTLQARACFKKICVRENRKVLGDWLAGSASCANARNPELTHATGSPGRSSAGRHHKRCKHSCNAAPTQWSQCGYAVGAWGKICARQTCLWRGKPPLTTKSLSAKTVYHKVNFLLQLHAFQPRLSSRATTCSTSRSISPASVGSSEERSGIRARRASGSPMRCLMAKIS